MLAICNLRLFFSKAVRIEAVHFKATILNVVKFSVILEAMNINAVHLKAVRLSYVCFNNLRLKTMSLKQ